MFLSVIIIKMYFMLLVLFYELLKFLILILIFIDYGFKY